MSNEHEPRENKPVPGDKSEQLTSIEKAKIRKLVCDEIVSLLRDDDTYSVCSELVTDSYNVDHGDASDDYFGAVDAYISEVWVEWEKRFVAMLEGTGV